MISFLPHYLEGLFGILAGESRDFRLKVRMMTGSARDAKFHMHMLRRHRSVWRACWTTFGVLHQIVQSGHSKQ